MASGAGTPSQWRDRSRFPRRKRSHGIPVYPAARAARHLPFVGDPILPWLLMSTMRSEGSMKQIVSQGETARGVGRIVAVAIVPHKRMFRVEFMPGESSA